MSEVKLFEPKSNNMELDYPELKGYKEFEDLSSRELKLCWLVGNRTSPIASYEKKKRLRAALEQCYNSASRNRKEYLEMHEGKIPQKLKEGITKMSTFNPSYRLRAKMLDEYMFDQLQTIVVKTEEEKKTMDIDEQKKYASLMMDVSAKMPEMINRMESGYGVTVKKEKEVTVKSSIERVRDRLD